MIGQPAAGPAPVPPVISPDQVRDLLRAGEELALADVRGEADYARGHPLWAANLPLSQLELQAWTRIPRPDTRIVIYGRDAGQARRARAVLAGMGYHRLQLLEGGVQGWIASGGELFADVNTPSKAFGELVAEIRATPSVTPAQLQAELERCDDVVVVDARRYDEFHTMSIPTATSLPGGELVLRIRELAPDPATRVVVNCAGRTRSIIGTQSLINAGLPNPVAALRNGTIGWSLSGRRLVHGATASVPARVAPHHQKQARAGARLAAQRAGAGFLDWSGLSTLIGDERTTYLFDVRSTEEFRAGHLAGFVSAPGGQLVQETDHHAPVRGARIVLADDDGVRAATTGSWLAQMGWETWVLDDVPASRFSARGPGRSEHPPVPVVPLVSAEELQEWRAAGAGDLVVLDVGPSTGYRQGHVAGAWYAERAELSAALLELPAATRYVVTSPDGTLARFAAAELAELVPEPVYALDGGTQAWREAGCPMGSGPGRRATEMTDRYRRPYEGTDSPVAAMQAYLDWEYGLVAQLGRDGTHGFCVI